MSKTKLLLNVVEDVRSLINCYQTLAEDLQELCEVFSGNENSVSTSQTRQVLKMRLMNQQLR